MANPIVQKLADDIHQMLVVEQKPIQDIRTYLVHWHDTRGLHNTSNGPQYSLSTGMNYKKLNDGLKILSFHMSALGHELRNSILDVCQFVYDCLPMSATFIKQELVDRLDEYCNPKNRVNHFMSPVDLIIQDLLFLMKPNIPETSKQIISTNLHHLVDRWLNTSPTKELCLNICAQEIFHNIKQVKPSVDSMQPSIQYTQEFFDDIASNLYTFCNDITFSTDKIGNCIVMSLYMADKIPDDWSKELVLDVVKEIIRPYKNTRVGLEDTVKKIFDSIGGQLYHG